MQVLDNVRGGVNFMSFEPWAKRQMTVEVVHILMRFYGGFNVGLVG